MMQDVLRKNAEGARDALENETLTEAFDMLDAAFIGRWRASESPEERETMFHRQQALTAVRAVLFEHLHTMAARDERDGERDSVWRARWKQLQQGGNI